MEKLDIDTKIKMYINGMIETFGCNLRCDYCSIRQVDYKYKKIVKISEYYPMEHILKAFSPKRLGGTALISLFGTGETLFPQDIEEFIIGLLRMGHYVQIVTNGTIQQKIKDIVKIAKEDKRAYQLMFSLSLHYIELKRVHKLQAFADIINWLKKNEINFLVSIVLSQSYIEILDEIREYCEVTLDVVPSINIVRNDRTVGDQREIMVDMPEEEYFALGESFGSQNFLLQKKEFKLKSDSYCYAGKWSFNININTGYVSQCLRNVDGLFNFYENIEEKPRLLAVGNNCKASYCYCSYAPMYHLMPDKKVSGPCGLGEYKTIHEPAFLLGGLDLTAHNQLMTEEEKSDNEMQWYIERLVYAVNMEAREYIKEKKYQEAVHCIEKIFAYDLYPLSYYVADTIIKYGNCLLELKEYKRALELRFLYEDMKCWADYCSLMGTVFLRNEMLQDAINMFLEAQVKLTFIEEGTNSYIPRYNLGVIYECLGEKDKAVEWYLKCGEYKIAKERIYDLNQEM